MQITLRGYQNTFGRRKHSGVTGTLPALREMHPLLLSLITSRIKDESRLTSTSLKASWFYGECNKILEKIQAQEKINIKDGVFVSSLKFES